MTTYTTSEFILRFNEERARKAKEIQESLNAIYAKNKPAPKLVEDNTEYFKLFDADKTRFLNQGYNAELAHSLACSLASARENSARGWSND
jgi:hypothetical protein